MKAHEDLTTPNGSDGSMEAMETFVIRIWRDPSSEWQGKIMHLPEGKACFFVSWAEALAYIQNRSGWLEDTGPPK